MKRVLSEKFGICIAVEAISADIYRELSSLFPEDSSFWGSLAESEDKHFKILLAAAGLINGGGAPSELVPDSLEEIDETFLLVSRAKEKTKKGNLSSLEACKMALDIESSTVEHHLQVALSEIGDKQFLSHLRMIIPEEKFHIDQIRDFMEAKGFGSGRAKN